MKRILFLTMFVLTLMTTNAYASESGFAHGNGDAWRYMVSGETVKNQWIYARDRWFYADENGIILQNKWFQDEDEKWYYFGIDGAMLHDTTTPDGYYVGSDGVWNQSGQAKVEETKPSSPNDVIVQKEVATQQAN